MRSRDKWAVAALAGVGTAYGLRFWLRHKRRIRLPGRVVVVTGGTTGHGFLVARYAAERGAYVVLAARDPDELEAAAEELRRCGARDVLAVPTDVSVPEQAEHLIDRTMGRFGRIDILINNAGIISVGPLETVTIDEIRSFMEVNFWGAVYCTMAALPHMRRRRFGRIGNVVSVGGKRAVPHLAPYTVSKFALAGWTQALRVELARDNILVTGIYPSTMRTGGHTHAWYKGQREAEYTWFALGDSVPILSSSAEGTARAFWDAILHGDAEVSVGWQSRMVPILNALLPNLTSEMLSVMNHLLPAPENTESPPVQGQNLHGALSEWFNRAVPPGTRPALGHNGHAG